MHRTRCAPPRAGAVADGDDDAATCGGGGDAPAFAAPDLPCDACGAAATGAGLGLLPPLLWWVAMTTATMTAAATSSSAAVMASLQAVRRLAAGFRSAGRIDKQRQCVSSEPGGADRQHDLKRASVSELVTRKAAVCGRAEHRTIEGSAQRTYPGV